MGLVARKPAFVAEKQQRHRPACADTQSAQFLCYSLIGKRNNLTNYCTCKNFNIQASLCNCADSLKSYLAPEVIKLFSCSTQLSMKFILLINVKMPTIVGILTFISMINTTSEKLKAGNLFICRYFCFYEQLKYRAQLSRA